MGMNSHLERTFPREVAFPSEAVSQDGVTSVESIYFPKNSCVKIFREANSRRGIREGLNLLDRT